MTVLVVVVGDTAFIWIATAVAAIANVVANLVLVPRYGIVAAAADTALAYGILLVGVCIYFRRSRAREWLSISWPLASIGVGCTGTAYLAASALTSQRGLFSACLRGACILVSALACAIVIRSATRDEHPRAEAF
jgi:O-antigen/teichoic acid export membrane protein